MRYQILFFFIILSFLISCGPSEPPKNTTTANSNSNANKSSNPLGTNKTPETDKTNDAAAIKPVIDGFYEALKKKDESGAKKYLSAAALKYYETEAKTEKKTWFAFLLEAEDPIEARREVRNEKITGDKATAEIKGGPLGVFTPISFIKEDGTWKFDSPAVSQSNIDIPKTDAPSDKPK